MTATQVINSRICSVCNAQYVDHISPSWFEIEDTAGKIAHMGDVDDDVIKKFYCKAMKIIYNFSNIVNDDRDDFIKNIPYGEAMKFMDFTGVGVAIKNKEMCDALCVLCGKIPVSEIEHFEKLVLSVLYYIISHRMKFPQFMLNIISNRGTILPHNDKLKEWIQMLLPDCEIDSTHHWSMLHERIRLLYTDYDFYQMITRLCRKGNNSGIYLKNIPRLYGRKLELHFPDEWRDIYSCLEQRKKNQRLFYVFVGISIYCLLFALSRILKYI